MQLIQNGQDFSLGNFGSLPKKLPLGTYNLLYNQYNNSFYLHLINDIDIPNKIYGDVLSFSERVCIKYKANKRNLGVLLIGTKGSSKTTTAKIIANQLKLPVIIISEGYDSSEFISFITDSSLGDCVILIDEFEKLYSDNTGDSNKLLSLLDGPYNTHHMFVFTANNFKGINNMMKNRPSRIHFLKEFGGLDEFTVKEIGNDLLNNKEYIPELIEVSQKMSDCTFDIIMSICADCNLFKESPKQVAKFMNIILETTTYNVFEEKDNKQYYITTVKFGDDEKWSNVIWLENKINGSLEDVPIDLNNIIPIFKDSKTIIFDISETKSKLILKRIKESSINYAF